MNGQIGFPLGVQNSFQERANNVTFLVCKNVNQEQTNNVIIIGVEKGIQERANDVTFRCAKRITGMGQ